MAVELPIATVTLCSDLKNKPEYSALRTPSFRPLAACAVCYLPTVAAARAVMPSLVLLHEKSEAAVISSLTYQSSADAAEASPSEKLQAGGGLGDDRSTLFAGPLTPRQNEALVSAGGSTCVYCG